MKKILGLVVGLLFIGTAHAALPAGYTELEYIEFTGTQYIATNITSYKNTDVLKIKIMPTDTSNTTFITFVNPNVGEQQIGLYVATGGNIIYQYGTQPRLDIAARENNIYTIQASNGYITVNDSITTATEDDEFTILSRLLIGAADSQYGIDSRMYKGRIYYFRYEDKNGNVLFEGIPAQHGNDVGFYDLVSGQFFTNQGTGTFTAGPATCRNLVGEMKFGSLSGLDGSEIEADNRAVTKNFISVTPDTYYSFNVTGNDFIIYDIYAYDSNKTFLRPLGHPSVNNVSVQIPSEGAYIKYSVKKNDNSQVTLNDFQTYMKLASCVQIQVATKKYNDTAFSPVVTALNSAISTIKTVVTNTINQAAAVSALQTGKQTMPNASATNGTCPNYKQCLLVETSDGTPQWFVITDPFRDFVAPILGANLNGNNYHSSNGYTQLEYIESDGTQWIDTNFSGTTTTQINADFQLTEAAYTILFGTGGADVYGGSNISNYFFANPIGQQWGAYVNGSFTYTDTNTDLNRHMVRYNDGNNYYIDDTLFISNKQPSFNKNIYLFASNNDTAVRPTKAKMYSVKIYDNGTLVRDMVPVFNHSAGKRGMYDKVNGVFYGNANTASGATDFTAGPIVNNDAEIVGNLWDVEWNASPANNFSGGTLHGVALCSSQSSPTTSPDLSGTNIASNCWCRVKSIETNGQNVPVTRPWVLFSNEAMMGCSNRCSLLCSNWLTQNISNVRPGFLAP